MDSTCELMLTRALGASTWRKEGGGGAEDGSSSVTGRCRGLVWQGHRNQQ